MKGLIRLPLHRVQLMRLTRRALVARAPWMRVLAVVFFAVAFALVGVGVVPGTPIGALGWTLVALGVAHAANAAALHGAQARGLLVAIGAAYAVSGSLLLADPVLGPLIVLAAVSTTFVLGGLLLAVAAVASRHAQWTTAAPCGIAIAAFGIAVALAWPAAPHSALAITFSLAAAAQGAACLRLARVGERLAQKNLLGLRKNPSTRQPSGARATCLLPFGRQT